MARRHLDLAMAWTDDETATIRRYRKHLRWYLQGYPVGAAAHRRAGLAESAADARALLDEVDAELALLPAAVRAPRGRTDAMGRLVLPDGWCADADDDVAVVEPALAPSGG